MSTQSIQREVGAALFFVFLGVAALLVVSDSKADVLGERNPKSIVPNSSPGSLGTRCEASTRNEIEHLQNLANEYFKISVVIPPNAVNYRQFCHRTLVLTRELVNEVFLTIGLAKTRAESFVRALAGSMSFSINDEQLMTWFCRDLRLQNDQDYGQLCEPLAQVQIIADRRYQRFLDRGPVASHEELAKNAKTFLLDEGLHSQRLGDTRTLIHAKLASSGVTSFASRPNERSLANQAR